MNLWIKVLHLASVLAWGSGLLFLFRLLAAQRLAADRPEISAVYGDLAKRLLYRLMHPAMGVAILVGGWLIALSPGVMKQPWIHMKLTAVLLLVGLQIFGGIARKKLSNGQPLLSARVFSLLSLAPVVLLLAILVLVVVRPLGGG